MEATLDPFIIRRAVEKSLVSLLDPTELKHAMEVWDTRHKQKKPVSAQAFAQELSGRIDLNGRRSALVMQVSKAAISPNSVLRDGKTIPKQHRRAVNNSAARNANFNVALEQVLVALIDATPVNRVMAVKAGLVDRLENSRLPMEVSPALIMWLNERSGFALPEIDNVIARRVLTSFVKSIAGDIGPVAADKMLAQSVQNLEKSIPELHDYVLRIL